MAIGKNKRISKGKKGGKKKAGDPFLKKEWYELKAPSMFQIRNFGKTLVTKSQGTKLAADGLRGRVYEINLADLNNDEDQGFRKIKLCCEDIQGKNCLTDFYGMDITRDKLCSLIRKWHSLIEAYCDVKTTDGYLLRMFCIGFTMRRPDQVRSTCYARSSFIRAIRKKMIDIMTAEASKVMLRDLVKKFIPESIGKEIEKACSEIFPLQNVLIRKVKILKKPKLDVIKLMELHGEGGQEEGKKVVVEESKDAENILSAEIKE
eukprot:GHVT01064730.1.p1 GENE.GHVT01064730.1~~GHVT01064730.1.p1  ORF type:complete len:262 (-),score=32.37 GHVT01064730.1:645-1430(-)